MGPLGLTSVCLFSIVFSGKKLNPCGLVMAHVGYWFEFVHRQVLWIWACNLFHAFKAPRDGVPNFSPPHICVGSTHFVVEIIQMCDRKRIWGTACRCLRAWNNFPKKLVLWYRAVNAPSSS